MTDTYTYRIDNTNVLVSVSDNWDRFAVDNAGGDPATAERFIGKSLDQFIDDDETRSLYALVLDSVRVNNRPVAFAFRCDSPAERRFCELRILPCADGSIDFESSILRTEPREPVPLLESDVAGAPDDFLKCCSTCKRIAIGDAEWIEIEQAMQRLKLDERERTPRLSHGLCADCHERIVASL